MSRWVKSLHKFSNGFYQYIRYLISNFGEGKVFILQRLLAEQVTRLAGRWFAFIVKFTSFFLIHNQQWQLKHLLWVMNQAPE